MKIRRKLVSWTAVSSSILLLVFASGCARRESGASGVEARIARVENGLLRAIVIRGEPSGMRLEDRMAFHKVPGVSIAVINGSRVEWAKGYGVMEAGTDGAVGPETLFQAASISKPVAALAALRTVEKGLVGLDEDVNSKLRSWKVPENEFTAAKKVTLRRLLSHTAGLTVHGFRGYASGEPVPTLPQVLDGVSPANSGPIRVDIVPGFRFRYSGGGYTVMQQLLIDLYDRPFPEIMKELVLDPLGMTRSTYEQPLAEVLLGQAAAGHRADGEPVKGLRHTYPEMAAAGLWTTPSDLARFAIEIMKARSGHQSRTISAATAEEMLAPVLGGYGLGLTIRKEGRSWSFGHGGANEGFKCQLIAYPELGMGAAVMTNGDAGSDLGMEILRAISAEYGWGDLLPKEKVLASIPAEIYDRCAGRYRLDTGPELDLSRDADGLVMRVTGLPVSRVYPESETAFFVPGLDAELTFIPNPAGGFDEIDILYQGRRMKATRSAGQ
jgi:CubicO group peptidase (beta-lactamase class C family)